MRLQRDALQHRRNRELFRKVFPPGGFFAPYGFDAHRGGFEAALASPLFGIFVSYGPDGLALVKLPSSDDFMQEPQFGHFWAEPGAKSGLIAESVGWIKSHGYTTFTAVNASGHPDRVWARCFRKGGKAKPVGTVMRFV